MPDARMAGKSRVKSSDKFCVQPNRWSRLSTLARMFSPGFLHPCLGGVDDAERADNQCDMRVQRTAVSRQRLIAEVEGATFAFAAEQQYVTGSGGPAQRGIITHQFAGSSCRRYVAG